MMRHLRETSAQTAARFIASYRRNCSRLKQPGVKCTCALCKPPRYKAEWKAERKATKREHEASLLEEVMLEQAPHYEFIPSDLFRRVRDEYGTCSDRRLWRALRALVECGSLERFAYGSYRRPRLIERAGRAA